jgi:hypothetical protein
MLGIMWTSNAAPAARVLFPSAALIKALDADMRILDHNRFSITIASDTPHLSATLYNHGARIVLPAGLTGCIPAPDRPSA